MWRLMWCLAIACGPGDIKTDLSKDWYADKETCVAEAESRLRLSPQMMFICEESNPPAMRRFIDQLVAGKKAELEPGNVVLIGPKRLTY